MSRRRAARVVAPFGLLAVASSLCLGLAACASQPQAQVEYTERTDFSSYASYRWITEDLVLIQSGTGNEKIRNVENERRIRAAVERELAAKGLAKAEGEAADLILAFTVGTRVRYKIQGGGQMTFDLVTEDAARVTRSTLTLYLFDGRSNEQVWQASTRKDLPPGADPDKVIPEAVNLLLAEFPPD